MIILLYSYNSVSNWEGKMNNIPDVPSDTGTMYPTTRTVRNGIAPLKGIF